MYILSMGEFEGKDHRTPEEMEAAWETHETKNEKDAPGGRRKGSNRDEVA